MHLRDFAAAAKQLRCLLWKNIFRSKKISLSFPSTVILIRLNRLIKLSSA